MRETHSGNQYVPGSYWKVCPRCGFDYRIEDFRIESGTEEKVCYRCVDDPPTTPSKYYGGK